MRLLFSLIPLLPLWTALAYVHATPNHRNHGALHPRPHAKRNPSASSCLWVTGRHSTGTGAPASARLLSTHQVWHGKGTEYDTQYDGQFHPGGSCMYDDLPQMHMPSVAINSLAYLEGLACGACLEVENLVDPQFVPHQWSTFPPEPLDHPMAHESDRYFRNSTLVFVNNYCPGGGCMSGLDHRPEAWRSVVGDKPSSEYMVRWKFTSCEALFRQSKGGGDAAEVHWRDGSHQGYCDVQPRGMYRPVVQIEYLPKGEKEWQVATHRDQSFFEIDNRFCQPDARFAFRLTSADGEIIETELDANAYAAIGQNVKFRGGINFARADGMRHGGGGRAAAAAKRRLE